MTGSVIVVDDDPSVRKSLGRLFRSVGLDVRAFRSAEELLGHEDTHSASCIIVDVHLGRMSGLELKAALGERAAGLHFIFITGVDNPETEAASRAQGVAFFRKPFDAAALVETVLRCAGSPAPDEDDAGVRPPSAQARADHDRRIVRDDAPDTRDAQAARL